MSNLIELWQLYDNQGRPIPGKGGTKEEVHGKALLHGSSHVWIWRNSDSGVEVLLQKRSSTKPTWPSFYDISAAGHIDLGEDPLTAAIREAEEEIGHKLNEIDLQFAGVYRQYIQTPDKSATENEHCWLYLLELSHDASSFTLADGEVELLEWKLMEDIKRELSDKSTPDKYVPHGATYYQTIFEAIQRESTNA